MKTYLITTETVLSSVKHQWKLFCTIVLLFAILGVAGGWLFAGRGASETGGGGAEALPNVDLQSIAYTPAYYNDCLQALLNSYNLLNSYMNTAFSVELPESTLKESLLDRQSDLISERRSFQQITLPPLQCTLEETGKVYAPTEFLDSLTSQYKSRLVTVQMDLLAVEAATETVRQMSAPASTYVSDSDLSNNDNSSTVSATNSEPEPMSIVDSYTYLLDQAAKYGELLEKQTAYTAILDQLQNERSQIQIKSSQIEQDLIAAAETLNILMAETSQIAEEIGKTAYVNIRLAPNSKPPVLIEHSYRPAPIGESFAIIELFCILVGICAGAFFVVCREAKHHPVPTEES